MLQAPSVLFRNAHLTDDHTRQTYDVFVKDGQIACIEPSSPDAAEKAKADQVIDLRGAFVAPSMVDHHVHFQLWAKALKHVNVGKARTLSQMIDILKEAMATFNRKKTFALIGQKLSVGAWSEDDILSLTKTTLDEQVDAEIPIVVYFSDLHSMVVNSAALELLEVYAESSGLLLEKESFEAMVKLNKLDEEHIHDDLLAACQDAARKGVTKIVDLDLDFNIRNWVKRVNAGMNLLRVECGMYADHIPSAVEAGYKSGDVVPGGQGLVTVGPYKIITDGSLGTRTACCHDAYPSPPAPPHDFGYFAHPQPELKSMLQTAVDHDFRLAIHAIGDKAHTLVFDTLKSLDRLPLAGSSIEHAQQVRWEDLKAFGELGLAASVQPMHQIDDIELADRFWPGRTDRAFAYKALADAGIELRLGSDAPVAVLDPWLAIAAAISRRRPGEGEEEWHPEQKISLRLAYEASTSGRRTQVKQGDVADLCILDVDPLQASVEQLRDMHVQATMLAGRFTWNALQS